VANTALILFWAQFEPPEDFGFEFGLFLLLAALNGAALAGCEIGAARGWAWLAGRWVRHLVWLSVLVYLSIPTLAFIIEPDFENGSLWGLFALVGALAAGYVRYRHRAPDLTCLAFAVMAACLALLTLIGKGLFE